MGLEVSAAFGRGSWGRCAVQQEKNQEAATAQDNLHFERQVNIIYLPLKNAGEYAKTRFRDRKASDVLDIGEYRNAVDITAPFGCVVNINMFT